MTKTVAEIAESLGAEVVGDGSRRISGVASLERAGADEIAFIDKPERVEVALQSAAGCLVVPSGVTSDAKPLIQAANPKLAFVRAIQLFQSPRSSVPGVHPTAVVGDGVSLGDGVRIGPFAVIEAGVRIGAGTDVGPGVYVGARCVIGAACALHPHAVLYADVTLGDRVAVHAGAVLGSDGFGYVVEDGVYHKFPQIGRLEVGDDVDIGANTTIDRGALDATVIERGAKIDNLVQIAHNVTVGEHAALSAQVGVAGSSTVEARAVLAGQVGVADHVTIGEGAIVGAQGGVPTGKKIRPKQIVWGTPARPLSEFKAQFAATSRLPKWRAELDELRAKVAEIDALRAQVAELDGLRARVADVDDLQARVAELDALRAKAAEVDALRTRLAELERRIAQAPALPPTQL